MTSAHQAKASQPFPLERILTASAKDYVESADKKLSDYEMIGVHVKSVEHKNYPWGDIKAALATKIPNSVEIVTGYVAAISAEGPYIIQYADATALIPKAMPYIDESGESR